MKGQRNVDAWAAKVADEIRRAAMRIALGAVQHQMTSLGETLAAERGEIAVGPAKFTRPVKNARVVYDAAKGKPKKKGKRTMTPKQRAVMEKMWAARSKKAAEARKASNGVHA